VKAALRFLNFDGALCGQTGLPARFLHEWVPLADWGPRIRLACGFRRFRAFERALADRLPDDGSAGPPLTLYGSGDFHHVTLALLARLSSPFNLLLIDKHPDWVRGVPFLHCGTWLAHALRLPMLRTVFHVGGDIDFDNRYRPLAPWRELRSGRVRVFPAARKWRGGGWNTVPALPLSPCDDALLSELLDPHREELARHPLYVSLDKDVIRADEAAVNWDSGVLTARDVTAVLRAFLVAARAGLAGADLVGDWSAVRLRSPLQYVLHWLEHPRLRIDPRVAHIQNQAINAGLIEQLFAALAMTDDYRSAA
jgi:hypothetical protein